DLGLPDMDGKDVLTRAREFYSGPIIILSARDKEAEKIAALDLGANDYVEKPFGVGELLARVRANLRQAAPRAEAVGPLTAGDLVIDLEHRLITRAGEAVRVTPKEYDVLAHLARNAGKVVGHRDLLTAVWGKAHADDTQYLRVVIGQLRQKLETDPAQPRLIATEPGVGYRLVA
ncbi:MAG: winged helix-turn-helix domain-containing protein, partial [Brevundimonas sp.]